MYTLANKNLVYFSREKHIMVCYYYMKKKDLQILQHLSDNLTPYESVSWLGSPHVKLAGKSPYDMIKAGRGIRVYSVLHEDIKILKAKKKKRS